MEGELQSGFELPLMKLAVITEEELFKNRIKKKLRLQFRNQPARMPICRFCPYLRLKRRR
jgi:transcription-repair coupling factor (superfamily II helicase)